MERKINVFVCSNCGYEDSAFIPDGMVSKYSKQCDEGFIQCPNCKKIVKKDIQKMDYEDGMSFEEYIELVNYIHKNHSLQSLKGKLIKYISSTYDFRTGKIYKISLDGKDFAKVNENRHRNLKKWIIDYLNS